MIIIIITMLCYKSGKSMIMATCYKNDDDDTSDKNKDKVCLLLRRCNW